MNWDFLFFFNCVMLGVALSMDAFSVSLADGLNDPCMKLSKRIQAAGIFGLFQGIMPMIGWVCVHHAAKRLQSFEKLIPWIALILLCFIGFEMIKDGFSSSEEEKRSSEKLSAAILLTQGIATSIDALSVGFAIADYGLIAALTAVVIIAVITFILCMIGLKIGQKAGTRLSSRAQFLGGAILIAIGIEIFVQGLR